MARSKKKLIVDAEVLEKEANPKQNAILLSKKPNVIPEEENFKDSEIVEEDIETLPQLRNAEIVSDSDDEEDDIDDYIVDEDLSKNKVPGLVVTSALQRYLAELRKYSLMTREEEHEAALKAFEDGDIDARNRLVTSNLRLVVKIAMGYRRAYAQMLDLIQEGNAGLVQAVNRFNPYRGVKLSTYSAWWIRAYILKFLMDNKSLVRMGTTDAQRKLFFRLKSEAAKMYALTQKFDAKLLAEKIGVETQDVIDMQQRLSKNDSSLDTPIGENGESRQIDFYAAEQEDPSILFEKKQLLKILQREINEVKKDLNERDTYIFHERILSDDPITLQDVGDKYGVTRERARQLEARVIEKIRHKLKSSGITQK